MDFSLRYKSVDVPELKTIEIPKYNLHNIPLPTYLNVSDTQELNTNYNWGSSIQFNYPEFKIEQPSESSSVSSSGISSQSLNNVQLKNGDVVTLENPDHKLGHTAIYLNGKWYSDFRLKGVEVYGNKKSTYKIFRNPDSNEAEQGALNVAKYAQAKSSSNCAKYVRKGFERLFGDKYKAEGYNGKDFGEYLKKRGWVQIAKKGTLLLYTPTEVPIIKSKPLTIKDQWDGLSYFNDYDLPIPTNNELQQTSQTTNFNWADGIQLSQVPQFYQQTQLPHTSLKEQELDIKTKNLKGRNQFDKEYDALQTRDNKAESRRQFFTKLAYMESGYNSSIRNKIKATGYFLFMPETIKTIASTYDDSKIKNITPEELANNPSLQMDFASRNYDLLLSGFTKKDIETAKKMGYSESALIAGAWLGGNGGVRAFLYKGKNRGDGGTTVKARMDEFNNMI